MHIELYNCTSPNNKVVKNLTQWGSTLEGNLKEECSIIDPIVLLNLNSPPVSINYCYIQEFERYYFIKDIVCVNNNLWRLTLHVDVLHTYRNQIKALTATISKQENINSASLFYNDNTLATKVNTASELIEFPHGQVTEELYMGFREDLEYILITAGAPYALINT